MDEVSETSETQGSLASTKNVFTSFSSSRCYFGGQRIERGEFSRTPRPHKTYNSRAAASGRSRSLGAIHNIQHRSRTGARPHRPRTWLQFTSCSGIRGRYGESLVLRTAAVGEQPELGGARSIAEVGDD